MNQPTRSEEDPGTGASRPERFKVGTLTYTRASLALLFLWLLWGDFCFSLMETVVPSILPIKLNELGASNWVIGLLVVSIPNLMNTAINPFVSFRSDRFRSRWGRRIPFLAVATPFLVLFLVLLGASESLGWWLHGSIRGHRFSPTALIILTVGVLMVGFQLFNDIINAVYWYLFNDVVPRAFLARFMALFRMVGSGAGAFYNFFIFKYAGSHMREIFAWAGLAYFVAFMLMCWRVKEGQYPPPPPNADGRPGLWSAVRTYGVECFSHRFYWYFFLANTCVAMTWVTQSYRVLQLRSVGIDLATVGKVTGVAGIISTALLFPASVLADRFHPLRVLIAATVVNLLVQPIWLLFLVRDYSPRVTLAIFVGVSVVTLPATTLYTASELPMYMKLLPPERYGQFCSANAMVRSVFIILSGVVFGVFIDAMARVFPVQDYCYRFLPVWNVLFYGGSSLFLALLYREWRRLGGAESYHPPNLTPVPAPCEFV